MEKDKPMNILIQVEKPFFPYLWCSITYGLGVALKLEGVHQSVTDKKRENWVSCVWGG